MGKKTNKKGISLKNKNKNKTTNSIANLNLNLNNDYLLGSSADTNSHDLTDSNLDKQLENNTDNIDDNNHKHNQNHIYIQRRQAYNYAVLNDDIVEEAALLSSSEGYDAEYDADSIASTVSQNLIDSYDSEVETGNYFSTSYPDSVISEVSDSILILEERDSFSLIKWYKRPSVLMSSLIAFFYSFSIGISLTPELELVLTAICYQNSINHEMSNCVADDIQQKNASIQKWATLISSIIQILVSTKIGQLSDIYGRKPVIIWTFTTAGLARFLLIFILTPEYFTTLRFITGNMIGAFGGSLFVLLGLANSYTIDVVHDKNRLQSLGKVTGSLFLGLSLGPLFTSFLARTFKIKAIQFMGLSSSFFFISIVLIILFIPESRSLKLRDKSRRNSIRSQRKLKSSFSWIYILGLSSFIDSFRSLKFFWVSRPVDFKPSDTKPPISGNLDETTELLTNLNSESQPLDMTARLNVILLLAMEILINFCTSGSSLPIVLYLLYRFDLNQSQLSLFVGISAGSRALVLTVINPWLQNHLLRIFIHDSINVDFIDVISVGISIFCGVIASLTCSLSYSISAVFIYVLFSSFVNIGSPVIDSALLKYNSNPGKNGEFFGALAFIRNIVNLVSPWVFLSLFSFGMGIGRPQAIFYIIVLFFTTAGFLLGCLRFKAF